MTVTINLMVWCVNYLLTKDPASEAFVRQGGIPDVVTALRTHISTSVVVGEICRVLANIGDGIVFICCFAVLNLNLKPPSLCSFDKYELYCV